MLHEHPGMESSLSGVQRLVAARNRNKWDIYNSLWELTQHEIKIDPIFFLNKNTYFAVHIIPKLLLKKTMHLLND